VKEDNQNKSSSQDFYCLILKHKIHCSQLEGTEASKLPEERRYEFCLNKCPVYKTQKQNINNKDG
jgi:hypothetical protein